MKNKISLFWARIQLKVIKFLPIAIAVIYLLNTSLAFFGMEMVVLSLLGGMSLLPLIFLYISSYAFRFCDYHRMFLHYVTINDCLNWVDCLVGIPVSDLSYFMIIVTLFGIICFIALFMFLKEKEIQGL